LVYRTCDMLLDEMLSIDQHRKYSNHGNTIISGHLDCLKLISHICHKYFLRRSILLPTPYLISSNALSLTLSLSLSLSCSLPASFGLIFKPCRALSWYYWINESRKELFSFQRLHLHKIGLHFRQKYILRAFLIKLHLRTLFS